MATRVDTNFTPRVDTVFVMEDTDGRGGYVVVVDAAAMNAIPAGRRKAGMLCCVQEGLIVNAVYQLESDLTTWSPFSSALSPWFLTHDFIVYVNAETGNDENPGTQLRPLRTLDTALQLVPNQWGKKARIYLAEGDYDLPAGATYVIGNGVGPEPEPLVIWGTMETVDTRTINVANLPGTNNQCSVFGAAMTPGQYRGYYIFGNNGGADGYAQIADNGTNTITCAQGVDFNGEILIQRPASRIGVGESNSAIPATLRGLGKGKTLVELFSVSVQERSVADWPLTLNLESLSVFAWNSWIGASDANAGLGNVITVDDAELTGAPSLDVPDLAPFVAASQTSDLGSGLLLHNFIQIVFTGAITDMAPSVLVADCRQTGGAGTISARNGSRVVIASLDSRAVRLEANDGSSLTILGSQQAGPSYTGVINGSGFSGPLLLAQRNSFIAAAGCILIGAGNSPVIRIKDASTGVLGSVGNADAPTGSSSNTNVGVLVEGLSRLILKSQSGRVDQGVVTASLVTGTGGDLSVDTLIRTWAQLIAAVAVQNLASAAAYNPN